MKKIVFLQFSTIISIIFCIFLVRIYCFLIMTYSLWIFCFFVLLLYLLSQNGSMLISIVSPPPGVVCAQSRRMSQLLTDMSTLTRLDEAQIMRPATTIDASQIIRKILEETASQFEERGIDVSINLPESLPMHGDASIIYSLFHNIFTNTLAHATNATRFDITAKTTREHYQFVMSDNGTGVPAESQSLIFERFYRIDKGRSRRLGGTGLGLAIVKNIALQYGGTATAHTTPGGGLTIEISIEPFCESK